MRYEFPELYLRNDDRLQALIGNTVPEGFRDAGRRVDWREDAGEAAFLERQLEHIEARIYEYKLREMKFRRFFPVSNEGQGSAQIAYDIVRNAGMAKIIANGATDIPRADTFVDRHYALVRVAAIAFGYTTQELRNAAFSNVPLEARRGAAARRGMEEELNRVAFQGDDTHGMLGLLNHPNLTEVEASAPASGSDRTWNGGDKQPLEIIDDIADNISAVVDRTNEVHTPNTILLPVRKYEYIRKTPYSDRVSHSILRYMTDPLNGFGIDMIAPVPDLKDQGTGTTDLMVIYERSDEVVNFRIPMELRPMPPEVRGLEYLINMETEVAGLVIRYPLAFQMVYGI